MKAAFKKQKFKDLDGNLFSGKYFYEDACIFCICRVFASKIVLQVSKIQTFNLNFRHALIVEIRKHVL